MNSQRLLCFTFTMTLVFSLSGCTMIKKIGHDTEFEEYAESVFRRQNSVTSTLMMLSEDELSRDGQLYSAEIQMYEACEPLNEFTSREIDGLPMGVLFRRKVKASIKGCDKSIQRVESILKDLL